MNYFNHFYQAIAAQPLNTWLRHLPEKLHTWEQEQNKRRDYRQWEKVLGKLLSRRATCDFSEQVRIGNQSDISDAEYKQLESLLKILAPWRKGPFSLFGVDIDTEWRSDWKWQRLLPHIKPLAGRTVLDVGCGSGYHLWRMHGSGAQTIVGIDPCALFFCQFRAVWQLANQPHGIHFLPLGIEELPAHAAFDTVFSMGVLYHRKSPIEHLEQLKNQLVSDGELVLETLVIEGDAKQLLMPPDRYGKMNNVWFIPSSTMLKGWLEKVGFIDVRIVDENVTLLAEQRKTAWMQNESLADFLDPKDATRTIEGHPAPRRAILLATKM